MKFALLACVVVLVPVVSTCGRSATPLSSVASQLPELRAREESLEVADQAWTSRVVRILHGGRRATPEDMARFIGMPKGEVVDALMEHQDFLAMVLDYSLVFLGMAPQPKRDLGAFIDSYDPFNTSDSKRLVAVHGVSQFADGGEFLSLLDGEPELYAPRLASPSRVVADYTSPNGLPLMPEPDAVVQGTDEAIRLAILSHLGDLVSLLKQDYDSHTDPERFCRSLTQPSQPDGPVDTISLLTVFSRFVAAGPLLGLRGWLDGRFRDTIRALYSPCFDFGDAPGGGSDGRHDAIVVAFSLVVRRLEAMPKAFATLAELSRAPGGGLGGYLAIDYGRFPPELGGGAERGAFAHALGSDFYQTNVNSSTNFNRKRAAAVLKQYFCDDLIPLEVVLPSDGAGHGRDRHASEPACQACHYKLDPMAGFFRSKGVGGFEFLDPSQAERQQIEQARIFFGVPDDVPVGSFLVYDDLGHVANANLDRYLGSWRTPESTRSLREWNVGYVRSMVDPSRNEYGSSIQDLFAIIRKAPEVKRCMTKRLVDYMLGSGLRHDPAWIDALAAPLVAAGKTGTGSSQALRHAIKEIALSRAFQQRDPDPTVCYDRVDPGSPVPCEVASILQTSCASCHSSSSRMGGLALDTWHPGDEGGGQFDHRDSAGELLGAAESFSRIRERIVTSDPEQRMPPAQEMESRAREELFLWLEARQKEAGR